ncbi:alpha/beta fold hydrolase [Oceanisphaera pacifica]|uniref:Alpha/beta fold hydrolase n=1 Tax=Oceanisphaera pacifica TaxID=2818389 RepID=A0ABS3NES5_9GAMM|nr:alpha/beta fold hydrolase [Oceanisphaera pacifica]MBO1519086.1 alpha/beta fold hydrolase [Oceanisphaera pacifica]
MQLNFRRQGQGQAVIVIHGLFGSLDNLNGLSKALAVNYDVISVDLRNHGLSPRSAHLDYPTMAKDIIALIEQLALSKPILIGHSMGGKVAMMAAGLAPELIRAIIVADMAPVAYTQARHNAVFAGLQAVIKAEPQDRKSADEVLGQHVQMMGVRQFLLKSFIPNSPTKPWRFNVPALLEHYPNIMGWPGFESPYSGPVLFIKGGESDYLTPEYQAEVIRQFPKAKAKVIAGTGHWLHAEKPQLFNRLVEDFLAQVS